MQSNENLQSHGKSPQKKVKKYNKCQLLLNPMDCFCVTHEVCNVRSVLNLLLVIGVVNLKMTHRSVLSEKMKNRGAPSADCWDFCATQTPLRLNHRESSTSFCPTRDTTFSCRWATSSPPSCYWCSLSSSSSSSRADVKSKVWPAIIQSDRRWFALEFTWLNLIDFSSVFQSFIHRHPWGEWEHTHTHNLRTHTHTHTKVSLSASDRSSRSQSSSEEFEMDVAEVNVCCPEERRLGEFEETQVFTERDFCLDFLCVTLWFPVCFLDYKNNLLKEKVHMNTQPKVIDLDKGNPHACNVI